MRRSQLSKALAVGAGSALLAVILGLTPFGLALEENVGLRWLFHLRGPTAPPPQAVVIAINGETGRALGLPRLPRDWPRALHGRVIERLVDRGVDVIVFDFDFSQPGEAADDGAFADAIAAAGRVVLQESLEARKLPVRASDGRERLIWYEERQPPAPPLHLAARAVAPFPLPKLGQAVFQFWTFKASLGDAPTTAAVAVHLAAEEWHDAFVALLAEAGAVAGEELRLVAAPRPPPSPDWPDAGPAPAATHMRALMVTLRTLFLDDPGLAERAAARLAGRGGADGGLAPLRALLSLYAGSDQRYLNFYGPPGTIPTIPYQRLLEGESVTEHGAPVDLKGKVAFVGYSDIRDPAQPDRFYSVFSTVDGVDLSGVEIMAAAFGNLVNGETIEPSDMLLTAAVLAAFGFAAAVLATLLPALLAVPIVAALAVGYLSTALWLFSAHHLWWPVATPILIQMPLALLGGVTLQYLHKRMSERRVAEAISHYLPEGTFRDFVARGYDARQLDRLVRGTVLAADMAGFTGISEHKQPADLAEFMNAYFDRVAGVLKAHGSDFIEYRADSLMCAWVAAGGRLRGQPLRAALELVEAVRSFGEAHGVPLSVRVGINDGEFYLGHTGGGGRVVYSIVGDTANAASRLETLNKHLGTRILAAATALGDGHGFLVRHLGRFRVVGRGEPIAVAEVLATVEAGDGSLAEKCARFATAMARFEAGEWRAAKAAFHAMLRRWPGDGPSRFYLKRCEEYLRKAPASEPGVIEMAEK